MTFDRFLNWDRDTALAVAPRFIRLHPNWITTVSLGFAAAGLTTIYQDSTSHSAVAGSIMIFASRWIDWIDGYVARATGRSTNLGGLYDIAVGYVTMTIVMVVIGVRHDDGILAALGASAAILLRVFLMGSGWALARRQRLKVVPWNPQKLLLPRQRPCMRKMKNALDVCRVDYGIVLFSMAGSAGLHVWAWAYTGAVLALTLWVAIATRRFFQRVPPAAADHSADAQRGKEGLC